MRRVDVSRGVAEAGHIGLLGVHLWSACCVRPTRSAGVTPGRHSEGSRWRRQRSVGELPVTWSLAAPRCGASPNQAYRAVTSPAACDAIPAAGAPRCGTARNQVVTSAGADGTAAGERRGGDRHGGSHATSGGPFRDGSGL